MYRKLLSATALALCLIPAAHADLYIGAKTGPMLVDISGADDPTNVALTLGYELGILVADVGLEAEFSRTASDGDVAGQPLEVETNALYVSFVTPGPLYLKLRGGIADTEVSVGAASTSDNDTSLGVGLGVSAGILRFEIEYTQIENDVDFLSFGVQF